MSGGALVLAAHGSALDDGVNAGVRKFADQVAAAGGFDEVVAAFHRGLPHYSSVLDQLRSSRVTVVPFMTSGGYYCDEVLPRELARNRCFGRVSMRLTPPIGTHPGIERIAAERAVGLAADHGFALGETTLLVVGHGTKRHAKSRGATLNLASVLDRRLDVLESIACFLDDDPSIENARRTARGKNIIAISFLLADGPHAKRDVPGGLSIPTSECVGPPCHARVEGKYVVCDAPIGTDAGITPLVVEMATKSWLHKEVV